MPDPLHAKILEHLKSDRYRPQRARGLAREMNLHAEDEYHVFRDALRELMHQGRVILGSRGAVTLPAQQQSRDEFVGTYRHNRRGFGFVVPSDPAAHEDLYIPPGENGGAMTGDVVRAKITSRGQRDGKAIYSGRITEILERTNKRFVGTLMKQAGEWVVLPDGNTLTEPILAPDAASRHIKPGAKVVIELTTYPERDQRAAGVITEVLGRPGEKDVDLKSVIVQFNLPGDFPEEVKEQAREAIDRFNAARDHHGRLDLTNENICTIDPDDAKDYDDAISLNQLDGGQWELGVHIADVSYFIPSETAIDEEARKRGNSCYFPGHVIPMLPEILSNGVCSLQEGVPRLCKSAFITFDDDAQPIATRFANTIIHSSKRLRYREAQAIIDGTNEVPHPDGPRKLSDYEPRIVQLLQQMNALARRIQKRRSAAGQLVLNLPEVDLVLDEEGKVIDAIPEDDSFTHTLIEMFMVEANEAVARLLDSMEVPFLRRVHPDPESQDTLRLHHFVTVAGYKLPKQLDRKALQSLLASVKGKPEAFAINLAVLKSLTRAEYSPEPLGHYALASQHYCHFTSPIRRYADLTIHRLLDAYFEATGSAAGEGKKRSSRKKKPQLEDVPSHDELVELGRQISFTERRAESAERELRQVKILELLTHEIGQEFSAVVTGITNFGIFVQIQKYLIDGLIRYDNLMDDWWDVDERSGIIRGQRTGKRIGIGDAVKAIVVRVDPPRRELDLAISQLLGRSGGPPQAAAPVEKTKGKNSKSPQKQRGKPAGNARGGGPRQSQRRQAPRQGGRR